MNNPGTHDGTHKLWSNLPIALTHRAPHPPHHPRLAPSPRPAPARCRLSEEYEQITDKSLTVPSNTAQLMELKEYIDQTESVRIPQMEDQLRTVGSGGRGQGRGSGHWAAGWAGVLLVLRVFWYPDGW